MRYIVEHIILWIGALLMLPCLSSCQSEDDNLDADTTVCLYLGTLDKPVYPEEINLLGGSRAVDDVPGVETEVQTWQDGDVVKLTIKLAPTTGNALIDETEVSLTYGESSFTSGNSLVSVSGSKISLVLSLEHITAIKTAANNTYSLTVSASYSPSSGPSEGATAVSVQTKNMTSACALASAFAPIVLAYTTARLRVYAGQDKIISFNNEAKATNTVGNAYYFGTLDDAISGFTIKQGETLVYAASAYNPVTLEAGKAYAIDATFYTNH